MVNKKHRVGHKLYLGVSKRHLLDSIFKNIPIIWRIKNVKEIRVTSLQHLLDDSFRSDCQMLPSKLKSENIFPDPIVLDLIWSPEPVFGSEPRQQIFKFKPLTKLYI